MEFSTHEVPRRYDDDIDIYMSWTGQHTQGDVSCRGTRVWFHPDSCLIYDLRYQTPDEAKKNHEKAKNDFKTIDCFEVYGDDANLRGESIEEIISELKGNKISRKTYDELTERFNDYHYENLEDYIPKVESADYFSDSLDKFIAVYKREEILKELQEALDFGRENEVTFHWV